MKKRKAVKPSKVLKHLKEDIKESKKSIAEDRALAKSVRRKKNG